MTATTPSFQSYAARLSDGLQAANWVAIEALSQAILHCWKDGRRLFICGNGGSAANALHLANDLHYGIGKGSRPGLRVQALPANVAVLTCLANDEGYDEIFSRQLAVDGTSGDLLLVFSGSGNSPNVLKVLRQAKSMNIKSFAILGFSGGEAKALADVPIHFAIDDMQISEDMQMAVGHMIMQWLSKNIP
jgi:D-sedoheptulose 7-phosphate isomerase